MIKSVNGDDFSISRKIRQILLHWGYELTENDCNWIRTHNHLVHKRTLNHLAKLAMIRTYSDMIRTYSD